MDENTSANDVKNERIRPRGSHVAILKVSNLYKTYRGQKTPAVKGVDLKVYSGEIFGVLGLNGAGKSTMFKCIAGILPFEKGDISICGNCIVNEEMEAKKLMSFIPDNHAVFEELTGNEYVDFMADMYGVSQAELKSRKEELCQMVGLTKSMDKQIKNYSHGMKQKIALLGGIIHYPKLLIMDEPFVGVDPISLENIKRFMFNYVDNGNTIIFSSHILELVNTMCERICVVHEGEITMLKDVEKGINLNELFFNTVTT